MGPYARPTIPLHNSRTRPRSNMLRRMTNASHTAIVVRVFTFGFVNPRRLVTVEVRRALIDASRLLNTTLWWVIGQTGLRLAFGLALWLTWALTRG